MDRFRLLAIFKIISEGKLSESQEKAALNIFYEKHNILMSGANKHQNEELFTFCQNILIEMDALVSHRNISEMATQNQ